LTPSFAAKLSRLFEECRTADGRRWTNSEVVDAINADGQTKISASYLSELLSGKKDSPSIWVVKALADFFDQPVDYFVDADRAPRAPRRDGSRADQHWSLGARLNLLFAMATTDEEAPPTNAVVAAAVTAAGGRLSAAQLASVRNGDQAALPAETLRGVASFFKVPADMLTDDRVVDMLAAQLPDVQLLQDSTIRKIAYRAHALSEADRAIVTGLLDRLIQEDPGMSPDGLNF
jgi:transcriptional regulator with XRE-family HTH domain